MTIWLLNPTHHVEDIKVIKSCGLIVISEGSDSMFHDVKVTLQCCHILFTNLTTMVFLLPPVKHRVNTNFL